MTQDAVSEGRRVRNLVDDSINGIVIGNPTSAGNANKWKMQREANGLMREERHANGHHAGSRTRDSFARPRNTEAHGAASHSAVFADAVPRPHHAQPGHDRQPSVGGTRGERDGSMHRNDHLRVYSQSMHAPGRAASDSGAAGPREQPAGYAPNHRRLPSQHNEAEEHAISQRTAFFRPEQPRPYSNSGHRNGGTKHPQDSSYDRGKGRGRHNYDNRNTGNFNPRSDSKGHVSAPPTIGGAGHVTATCDLERFRTQVTPYLEMPLSDKPVQMQHLTLRDLWAWYEPPSLFGREVLCQGERQGLSSAYFIPFLSALQLFVPSTDPFEGKEPNGAAQKSDATSPSSSTSTAHQSDSLPSQDGKCRYRCKRPGWPAHMRLLCQCYARQYPWERKPLFQEIQTLAEGPPDALVPSPKAVLSTKILALHPSSWFAVAWWPAYRIPDEPLEAAFLVFHSISTLQQNLHAVQTALHMGMPHLPRLVELPVSGMMWYRVEGERWLVKQGEGAEEGGAAEGAAPAPPGEVRLSRSSSPHGPLGGMLKSDLSELQANAKRMGLGIDIEVTDWEGASVDAQVHSDFQWFLLRNHH